MIQQCVKNWFQGTGGYISQGVTGVRLFFTLSGGNWSTAWNGSGNVTNPPAAAPCASQPNTCWLKNFGQLMTDLKSYGIERVNPNIILDQEYVYSPGYSPAGLAPIIPHPAVYSTCNSADELQFLKWVPYGLLMNWTPDCQDNNLGYANGNANPYFWGWTPYFNALQLILQTINNAGLAIDDFELYGEINLTDSPVLARMIWDNKHGSSACSTGPAQCTDVLSSVRYYFSQLKGFSSGVVEYSVPVFNPTVAAYDCGSVYGDSAMLERESALLGAIAGPYGLFGTYPGINLTNGLPCGGTTSGMISLPVTYQLNEPAVTDIHAYMCVATTAGPCNTSDNGTSTSKTFFSDVWSLLSYRGLTSNYVVFGETLPNQPTEIYSGGFTQELASQEAAGYLESTLYTNHASNVTFRPFENPAFNTPYCLGGTGSGCTGGTWEAQYTQVPAAVNPPF